MSDETLLLSVLRAGDSSRYRAHSACSIPSLRAVRLGHRDPAIIEAARFAAAARFRCPNVRLILRPALPPTDRHWEAHNRIWHRVYHLNVCNELRVYRWIGSIGTRHHFRDETELWWDGYTNRPRAAPALAPQAPSSGLDENFRRRWEAYRRRVAEQNARRGPHSTDTPEEPAPVAPRRDERK